MPGLLMLTAVESGSLVLTHQTLIRLRISPLGLLPLSAAIWLSPAGILKSPSIFFLYLQFALEGRTATERQAAHQNPWPWVGALVVLPAHVCLASPQQRRTPQDLDVQARVP